MNANIISKAMETLNNRKERSAWGKGVTMYAIDLLGDFESAVKDGYFDINDTFKPRMFRECVLNGATDWKAYSWGGCALIYNSDIAKALCTPSELKRARNGERRPNRREEWLDVQARALFQAANLAYSALQIAANEG